MRIECPGFVDLQINGFAGVDFNDPAVRPDDLAHATVAIRQTGVTRFLPTLITSAPDRFARCARAILDARLPEMVGFHMEGPYISNIDGPRGVHPKEFVVAASVDDFKRRQEAAGGRIRIVTLAPEVPGVLPVIEYAVKQGVRVSIGHSTASDAEVRAAVAAGASLSTHLGNGCALTLPRHPNLLWEQLSADELTAGFIVDGHHLPPATVKAMMRAKSVSRTVLVTDAIAAAGRPPGIYTLNGVTVELSPTGRVSPPGAAWLAGSALSMDRAIGNTVRFTGLPLKEVLTMACERPASLIGIQPSGRVVAEWDEAQQTFRIEHVSAE
jgi:N-acetylglucosamine-6-phosphate deacetylase